MLISLVLFISCKKESVQEFPTSTKGEIQLSHVYYGNNSADWCSFYICDMGQLDIISDYILQINTAYAIGNYSGGQNLGDAMRQILRPLAGNYYIGGSNSYHGSLETGDYIVLAERWVEYYKNGEHRVEHYPHQPVGSCRIHTHHFSPRVDVPGSRTSSGDKRWKLTCH